jgi:DNA-binding response OmpR family regulator
MTVRRGDFERLMTPASGPRVLIVDDDDDIRDILSRVLTQAGYEVRLATNGREGLVLVGSIAPDLIILDLNMPVMNGFEVLGALRANKDWARIPVLVVTAVAGYTASHLGVRGTLLKPFNIIDVQAAVRLALGPARDAGGL